MRSPTDHSLAIAYGVAILLHAVLVLALQGIQPDPLLVENVSSAPVTIRIAAIPEAVPAPMSRPTRPQPDDTPVPRPIAKLTERPSSIPAAATPPSEPSPDESLTDAEPVGPVAPPGSPAVGAELPKSEIESPTPSTDVPPSTTDDMLAKYIADVRRRVLARKRYPALARRRAIEGTVIATFTIDANGDVEAASTQPGAPRLLLRPTLDAIHSASPFPRPPIGSIQLEIPLTYALKG